MRTSLNRFSFFASAMLMNAIAEGGEGAAAAPKPVLTATQKLEAKVLALHALITTKTAEYTEAVTALEAIQRVANVAAGDTVKATVGKGEKAQNLEGVVLGVVEDEAKGKLIKIQTGTGFDTMTFVLSVGQVTEVVPQVVEAVVVDEDQADVDAYLSQPEVAIAE
jgi:hypothetical protein